MRTILGKINMRILGLAKGLLSNLSKISLRGNNSFVRTGLKLTNTNLLHQVDDIAGNLNISTDDVKSVLSTYQKYLDDTGITSNIDFSKKGIVRFVEVNFGRKDAIHTFFRTEASARSRKFIDEFGFDILKDMIRTNIDDISPEAKFLLNDLKYLGLDQRSAEIVHRFEQEGIEYITSSKFKKFNKKMEELLQKFLNSNLEKPKKINNFGHGMGYDSIAAQYRDNVIEMNPVNIVSRKCKGVFLDENGKKLDVTRDIDVFVHEYFHYIHNKKLGDDCFHSMGEKSLFGYICEKKDPIIYKKLDHFIRYDDCGFHIDALERCNSEIHMQQTTSAVDYIKKNINKIYSTNEERTKALKIIEEAYQDCDLVYNSCRDYALKTPLETVAELGMYRLTGKIKSNTQKIDSLLEFLDCPSINI